ncbi:MAG: exosome complex protein Rrp42 [Nanoarchaeota archaeon]|nr:exosome complex protein Rrp42 [Nanoarchaeota archaeon]MBU2520386.1 exosome complex protein Rrp42 [Nanoarchaeota archaeon]
MNIQEQFIKDLASKGNRNDGRKEKDYREIIIEKDVIPKAEGSARVKFGDSEVIVGVKMGVGAPFEDKPDSGVMMIGAELSPIASPDFETGPPREDSIELARVVDRGIRESKMIDLEKLCIEKGEKVWMVFIDIQIINHDGNLIDVAALAAVTALHNSKMPTYEKDVVNYEKKTKKLPVRFKPITITVAKISGKFFVDTTLEEENAMDSRVSVAIKDDGNICAVQKGGDSLTESEIHQIFDLASEKAKELRKLIN